MASSVSSIAPTPKPAPHWHSREVLAHVHGVTLAAILPALSAGLCFYGASVLLHAAASVVSGLLALGLISRIRPISFSQHKGHVIIGAVLITCMLPASSSWYVAASGSALNATILCAAGGLGHYLWHPLIVSWATVTLVFPQQANPQQWAVLGRDHLVIGSLGQSQPADSNVAWLSRDVAAGTQGFKEPHPISVTCRPYWTDGTSDLSAAEQLLLLIRDDLPHVIDCLIGAVGGGIGEASIIALILGGILIIYHGYAHWTLPLGALLAALLTAAVWPIADSSTTEGVVWVPFRLYVSGQPSLPVGALWVIYHIIAGELLFAVLFVASDMTSSPLLTRGHLLFGMGIGFLTIALRSQGLDYGAAYWSILIMNTFVPLIDRATRRRVYGT